MSEYIGAKGEVYAARYLRDRNYPILYANYRTRFGEIDIVSAEKGTLLLIEVKTRGRGMISLPREAVTYEKQRKLSLTAAYLLRHENLSYLHCRFDVIEVYLDESEACDHIQHIRNAFESLF